LPFITISCLRTGVNRRPAGAAPPPHPPSVHTVELLCPEGGVDTGSEEVRGQPRPEDGTPLQHLGGRGRGGGGPGGRERPKTRKDGPASQ